MKPNICDMRALFLLAATIGTSLSSLEKNSSVLNIRQVWDVLDVELSGEKEELSLHCEKHATDIVELIELAHSEDPLVKLKRSQLRGNVTDLSMFNLCYEKALALLEKRELETQYGHGQAGHVRNGKSIGKFIKNIFHGGNKDFDLDLSIEKSSSKSKDYDYYDDYDYGYWRRTGPGCWVGRRWEDDRRWDDNRRRWGDNRQWNDYGGYDRDGDNCFCDDDLCCDCEPDRGGSCCRDWCRDMCDRSDWDFRIERFCDRPVHWCDTLCMKFEHCCNGHCRYY